MQKVMVFQGLGVMVLLVVISLHLRQTNAKLETLVEVMSHQHIITE